MKRNIRQLLYSIGMFFLLCYSLTSSATRQINLCMTNGTEKTIYTHISAIDPFDWGSSYPPSPDTYRPDKNFDRVALTPNDLYCQKEIVNDSILVTSHFDIAFSDTPDGAQWGLSRLKSGSYLDYWQVEESNGNVIAGRQGDGEADTFTISRPH